jgi:hypothetical protein
VLEFPAPIAVEYVPGLHDWHPLALSSEYVPATHALQLLTEGAPMTDENVPASQFVQAMDELAPSTGEYVPVGQLAHLSGSVQRSRNSVPYMMNLDICK